MSTYLGIDVGGTKVAMRLEGAGSAPAESSFRWPPAGDPDRDLSALGDHLRGFLAARPGPVLAAGVAVPATLGPAGQVVAWPNRPSWTGLELGGRLGEMLPGTTVVCQDDGDLAALAEAAEGGYRDLLYLGVGTGIGGGVVLDGRPQPRPGRGSAEVGHVVVDRSGPRCDCGRRGCVQALASGPAMLRAASELRGAPVDSGELSRGIERGEPWAVEARDRACAALATAVVSLAEVLRPEAVLIGGGAAALPGLVTGVAAMAAGMSRPGHPAPPVGPAALGALSSLRGALLLAAGV
ncbi:ROK family protein [Streptomyces sp. NBC_00102]|uniref:ROK family protein n=1 Tax=Streptomyces sp. NBC_00102 TaxID=2975652 RepID=UPI002250A438|nr:ROK family protein [Streptomyces sp. NBC_00102]MCX5399873.1 ROK family protein [Streptomyces sp. NBC_00102]